MIILHTADIHADSPLTSKLPSEKSRIRRKEILSTFRRMTREAVRRGAEVFIIAGDLFDRKDVGSAQLSEVLRAIEETPGLRYLYLPGNHEGEDALSSLSALPRNLFVFGEKWTYLRIGDVCFAGRSTLRPGMMDELKVDPAMKNILVLHGAASGKTTTSSVGIKELAGLGIDYVALGHYHGYAYHDVDGRCTAVYSGTPEARGFDEAHSCGFVLVNTEGRRVGHKFVPFSARNVRKVPVCLTGCTTRAEADEQADRALAGISREDMVRLVLVGMRNSGLSSYGTDYLTRKYKDSFFYFEAEDESREELSPDSYKNDRTLRGEFVRLTLSRTDLSDSDKERIIRAGLLALSGELRDTEDI